MQGAHGASLWDGSASSAAAMEGLVHLAKQQQHKQQQLQHTPGRPGASLLPSASPIAASPPSHLAMPQPRTALSHQNLAGAALAAVDVPSPASLLAKASHSHTGSHHDMQASLDVLYNMIELKHPQGLHVQPLLLIEGRQVTLTTAET